MSGGTAIFTGTLDELGLHITLGTSNVPVPGPHRLGIPGLMVLQGRLVLVQIPRRLKNSTRMELAKEVGESSGNGNFFEIKKSLNGSPEISTQVELGDDLHLFGDAPDHSGFQRNRQGLLSNRHSFA